MSSDVSRWADVEGPFTVQVDDADGQIICHEDYPDLTPQAARNFAEQLNRAAVISEWVRDRNEQQRREGRPA